MCDSNSSDNSITYWGFVWVRNKARLFTSGFYLNFTITPLLGNIYSCFPCFPWLSRRRLLGVTLWASQICALHNFFLLGRSLGALRSLREGRNSCSSFPGEACSPAQGLPASPCITHEARSGELCLPLLHFCCAPQFSLSGSNWTLSTIPYLKLWAHVDFKIQKFSDF